MHESRRHRTKTMPQDTYLLAIHSVVRAGSGEPRAPPGNQRISRQPDRSLWRERCVRATGTINRIHYVMLIFLESSF